MQVKITKQIAIALILLHNSENEQTTFGQECERVDNLIAHGGILTRNGCLIGIQRKGAVKTYTLTGHAHDGSDVSKDIASIARATVWVFKGLGGLSYYKSYYWDTCVQTFDALLTHCDVRASCA